MAEARDAEYHLTMVRVRQPILALSLLSACYRYTPLETSALQPGMSLRARISGAAADQIEPLLGRRDVRVLTGKVIAPGPDTVILEVPSVFQADVGNSIQTLNQRVSIPRAAILDAESRTLDRARTYAIAGGAAVVIGGFILKATVLDPGSEKLPGSGPPPEVIIPFFSWRLR